MENSFGSQLINVGQIKHNKRVGSSDGIYFRRVRFAVKGQETAEILLIVKLKCFLSSS